MRVTDLSTLKIHKLSQAQYERELAAGNIDENALYLTPDEDIDLELLWADINAALDKKADSSEAVIYRNDRVFLPGKEPYPGLKTLTVKVDTSGVHFIKVDTSNGALEMNALSNCWIELNGEKMYVGSNTVDTLVVYTNEAKNQPKAVTATAGDIIYFIDIDINAKIKEDTLKGVNKNTFIPGEDLLSTSRTLKVRVDTSGVHFVKVDTSDGELPMNGLVGRWVDINGSVGYIGANTVDTLVLYTDDSMTWPKAFTISAGDIIYPVTPGNNYTNIASTSYVNEALTKIPPTTYQAGTEDLVEGVSDLAPGTLYFVYEE